jgi:hypothetical protein
MTKTRWLALAIVAAGAGAAAGASCGGSASETPWPVEPVETAPRPAGEGLRRGNVVDTKKLPRRYGVDAGPGDAQPEPDE